MVVSAVNDNIETSAIVLTKFILFITSKFLFVKQYPVKNVQNKTRLTSRHALHPECKFIIKNATFSINLSLYLK